MGCTFCRGFFVGSKHKGVRCEVSQKPHLPIFDSYTLIPSFEKPDGPILSRYVQSCPGGITSKGDGGGGNCRHAEPCQDLLALCINNIYKAMECV